MLGSALLRDVGQAAGQITPISLQTRLVAFNASIKAERAGAAGRGFGLVADAVRDLAGLVEASSHKMISTTGLTSARNQRPFLLQTYRRDMGAGHGVVLKEVAESIRLSGRQWGGLRLAYHS